MTAAQAPEPAVDEEAGVGQAKTSGRPPGINLTAAAQSKVRELLAKENRSDLRLRIAVQPGGCSGLRYQLYFDDRARDGDSLFRFGDAGPTDEHMGQSGPDHDKDYDSGYESGPDE